LGYWTVTGLLKKYFRVKAIDRRMYQNPTTESLSIHSVLTIDPETSLGAPVSGATSALEDEG
jgi:hypothetical protein